MTKILTKLRIEEVSAVDRGASEGILVKLVKRADAAPATEREQAFQARRTRTAPPSRSAPAPHPPPSENGTWCGFSPSASRPPLPQPLHESESDPNSDERRSAISERNGTSRGLYLQWEGKRVYHSRVPTPRLLEPVQKYSFGTDRPNMVIEGDNLQVLVSLRPRYTGQIDVIYIDAPYNLGKDDFRYSDKRFHDPDADDSDAVYVTNEDGGRHTKWLNFMAPRVYMLWQLLHEERGVLFLSINDVELFRIGMLLNEILGEENWVGTIVWHGNTDNNPTRITIEHEYILCYAKSKDRLAPRWTSPATEIKTMMLDAFDRIKAESPVDLSPVSHPPMSRVGWPFEPFRLDAATGRGAKPAIERSVPSRCDAGALSLASSAGDRLPMLLCGRTVLSSSRHAASAARAWASEANKVSFNSSSRGRPLKLSIEAFCCGLPGAMYCHSTPLSCDQRRIAMLVNSVPLSETQAAGLPHWQ
jgi:DNA methylase